MCLAKKKKFLFGKENVERISQEYYCENDIKNMVEQKGKSRMLRHFKEILISEEVG